MSTKDTPHVITPIASISNSFAALAESNSDSERSVDKYTNPNTANSISEEHYLPNNQQQEQPQLQPDQSDSSSINNMGSSSEKLVEIFKKQIADGRD